MKKINNKTINAELKNAFRVPEMKPREEFWEEFRTKVENLSKDEIGADSNVVDFSSIRKRRSKILTMVAASIIFVFAIVAITLNTLNKNGNNVVEKQQDDETYASSFVLDYELLTDNSSVFINRDADTGAFFIWIDGINSKEGW